MIDEYYHYQGSLTTPGCDETVNWILFKSILPMSKAQKTILESYYDHNFEFAAGKGNNR